MSKKKFYVAYALKRKVMVLVECSGTDLIDERIMVPMEYGDTDFFDKSIMVNLFCCAGGDTLMV